MFPFSNENDYCNSFQKICRRVAKCVKFVHWYSVKSGGDCQLRRLSEWNKLTLSITITLYLKSFFTAWESFQKSMLSNCKIHEVRLKNLIESERGYQIWRVLQKDRIILNIAIPLMQNASFTLCGMFLFYWRWIS